MKRYSRKGHPALVLASSIVLALHASEETGPMVHPVLVSVEAASMSSHERPVFPSCSCLLSPRLPLLYLSSSTTMLVPAAPVVPLPLPLPLGVL